MVLYIEYEKLSGKIKAVSDCELFVNDPLNALLEVTNGIDDYFINPMDYIVKDNVVVHSIDLDYYRQEKDIELNNACNESITNGFDHEVSGVMYHFSFDTEAQLNYQGAERLLSENMVPSIDFTVFLNGDYARIAIDKIEMQKLTMAILKHKASNISKYRDVLMIQVQNATTKEEINNVNW